jgi:four helix bundle suffix protein
MTYLENPNPEISANTIISLIHQTNYLLDQQIRKLEEQFIKEGGIRENMQKARLNKRRKKN